MGVATVLAYYNTAAVITVRSFIVLDRGLEV